MRTFLTFAATVAIFASFAIADHFGLGQSAEEQAGCIPAANGGYVYRSPDTGKLLKCKKE